MKAFMIVIAFLMSTPSFAGEPFLKGKTLCEKHQDGSETCYRNADVDLNGKYQDRYDEYMRGAGKWDFISTSMYVMTLASLGATYYSLNEAQKYKTLEKERGLTFEEQKQYDKWETNTKNAAIATGGFFLVGLIGHGIELHYQSKAHTFAIEMGIKW